MRLYEIESTKYLHSIFNIEGTIQYNNDGSINIYGDVVETNENIDKLPVRFNEVSGFFICGNLITLEGCPRKVGGDFYCDRSRISSFEGGPEEVGGDVWAHEIKTLTSLKGLPKSIGRKISLTYRTNLPLLRLLFVDGLRDISFFATELNSEQINSISNLEEILMRYIGQGRKGALQCAVELTKVGYKENARL